MVQLAIDPVVQLAMIEARASIALQAYGSGEDTAELVTTFIACMAEIFVQCHEPELDEAEKIATFAELVEQVEEDRRLNINVYYSHPMPYDVHYSHTMP